MDDRERIADLEGQLILLEAQVAKLRRSDATPFLASVLSVVPSFIGRVDSELRIKYMNRVAKGASPDDLIGKSLLDFVAPEDVERARFCIEGVLTTARPESFRAAGRSASRRLAHYDVHVAPVSEPDGSLGALVIAADITDKILGAEELERSQQKLQVVVGATRMGLWSLDMKAMVMRWDARMFEIFGVTATPRWTDYVEDAVFVDDRVQVRRELADQARHPRFVLTPHRILRPGDEVRWVQVAGANYFDAAGRLERMVGGHLDITERRGLEDDLRQAQRREAVGSLAGGVAHSFNNLLTAIIPSLERIREVVPEDHLPIVDDATDAGRRAAELVQHLSAYSNARSLARGGSHRIGSIVEAAVGLFRRDLEGLEAPPEVTLTVDPSLPPVRCDPGAIEQVVSNVLGYARTAVAATPPPGRINVRVTAAGGEVRVAIDHDGSLLSDVDQRQIFEPFFPVGGGTKADGLGLATADAIVHEHGGTIEVESAVGEGTRMTICLSAREAGAVEDRPRTPIERSRADREHLRVLLVDDEELVRKVVLRTLADAGHKVFAVDNSEDAQYLLTLHPDIDLVLLDRSTPGGPQLALVSAVRSTCPAARILYFTGREVSQETAAEVDGVVNKPITRGALLEAITRAIDVPLPVAMADSAE